MIEKQITLLIPKSDLEKFEKLIDGFSQFVLNQYCEKHNLAKFVKINNNSNKPAKP